MRFLVFSLLVGVALGQTSNIIDILTRYRETQLLAVLNQAGLTDTLKTGANYTIFAPTNSAFSHLTSAERAALKNDTVKLTDILNYHLVKGEVKLSDMFNEKQLTSVQGKNIRINRYLSTGFLTVSGARVIGREYLASNGVVHLLYDIMTPPTGSVADLMTNDADLSTLLSVAQRAGIFDFFQDQSPITLFAPTNAAFQTLGNDVIQGLLANPVLLSNILKYHVIPGSLYSSGFHSSSMHTFDEDDKLRLHKFLFFGYDVDNGQIKLKDISVTNGVVHKIDKVLIPNSLTAQVNALKATATTAGP